MRIGNIELNIVNNLNVLPCRVLS